MTHGSGHDGDGADSASGESLRLELAHWLTLLSQIEPAQHGEAESLELVAALEKVKRAAAGAQARLTVRVDELVRERQLACGSPKETVGAGIGHQIALARMESPHRGVRQLGLAKVLVSEMPQTLAAMVRGDVREWQATLVARETGCADVETRRAVDERIADRLAGWGDAETVREVRKLVYATEPGAAVKRHAKAVSERRVTMRPAPDTMCYLTALLPAPEGVAAYASLLRAADRARAAGEPLGKGAVMADTLVERLTGQSVASDVPIEIGLVMSAETLLGEGQAASHLVGYGPIPAAQTRRLLRDTQAKVWIRRLFARPDTGQLVAMDSRRRGFTGQLRHFVILRDEFCRMPWCDAPIRHIDHPVPRRAGGPTGEANAQGLCEACSYAKEAPGWEVRAADTAGRHVVTIETPTGDRYASQAPDPPGSGPAVPPAPWHLEGPGVWSRQPRAG